MISALFALPLRGRWLGAGLRAVCEATARV